MRFYRFQRFFRSRSEMPIGYYSPGVMCLVGSDIANGDKDFFLLNFRYDCSDSRLKLNKATAA